MTTYTAQTRALLGSALLGLLFASGSASAGIADTKHNLGADMAGTSNNFVSGANAPTTETTEICVFCHTPHGSDTTAAVPLWNKKLPSVTVNSTYTTYADLGTSTLDAGTAEIGSVSIACLSCHDGTQALDNMLNAPGSGNYDKDGQNMDYIWTSENGSLTGDRLTTGIAAIGTDLRDDHPVSIQYGGGPAAALPGNTQDYGDVAADFRDTDFNFLSSNSGTLGSNSKWWVETGGDSTRNKTDIILYTRNAGAAGAALEDGGFGQTGYQPFVECASCHDPHSSDNATFLRISNDESGVCLACHVK